MGKTARNISLFEKKKSLKRKRTRKRDGMNRWREQILIESNLSLADLPQHLYSQQTHRPSNRPTDQS